MVPLLTQERYAQETDAIAGLIEEDKEGTSFEGSSIGRIRRQSGKTRHADRGQSGAQDQQLSPADTIHRVRADDRSEDKSKLETTSEDSRHGGRKPKLQLKQCG